MNNVKWDKQTVCVMPKTDTAPTKETWPEISKGDFWIIDGQHTLEAARLILQNPLYEHELKGDLQYWKAFVVWSEDWNRLRKISKFLNSGNKIKAFEASWAANIVAARDVWIAHGSPPKERENAKVQSPSWKVCLRTAIRKPWHFIFQFICMLVLILLFPYFYERPFVFVIVFTISCLLVDRLSATLWWTSFPQLT